MWEVECEALPGLEELLEGEVRRVPGAGRGLRFDFAGPVAALLRLRIAQSVYLVVPVASARPTGLLGEQQLRRLEGAVALVRTLHRRDSIRSFRLGAAGYHSSTFRRLASELSRRTGLAFDPDDGDLLLRVRRSRDGWEALLRISPRPLSTRSWRVRNMAGALNATIAAAMVELTEPLESDRFANLGCGSATLLIERLLRAPAGQALGYDRDPAALEAARANIAAAGLEGHVQLVRADLERLPREAASVEALVADLPYGNLVGSHAANTRLYPAILREAARLAVRGARFAVITHDIRLFQGCLEQAPDWLLERSLRVFQGGHRPQISLLRRR
ncbi:methyltransferase domain-containing protein [Candidatus Nephthysia bennettiae]|uniref:Methyltransferase domain-containing protein n=1 Tax=Candidatus Nephthysia bennettiae TaxID=3127016 RepID=A0A934N9T9_9BACT|nr:methyltransferase domain-containing protein [Candidatus Dormibacteraeota bacterium]MBJ7611999.1 methyltransferase domain-containing protein [Candidatus Dormibacteraeota bacterium]